MTPDTFTQMSVQLVFAAKNHQAPLHKTNWNRFFECISGIITTMVHKSIIVNGVSDHVHILLGLHPAISISDTVHEIKRNSTLFINDNKLCVGKFTRQEGYGGFTYSRSQLN